MTMKRTRSEAERHGTCRPKFDVTHKAEIALICQCEGAEVLFGLRTEDGTDGRLVDNVAVGPSVHDSPHGDVLAVDFAMNDQWELGRITIIRVLACDFEEVIVPLLGQADPLEVRSGRLKRPRGQPQKY